MIDTKRNILKWSLYSIMMILVYTLQVTPKALEVAGIKPVLLVPFVICVSIFEGDVAAVVFGVLSGLLWDFSSGRLLGYNALIVMACCIGAVLITMYLIKVNIVNALILVCITMVVHSMIDYFLYYYIWGYPNVSSQLTMQIIPMVLYTVLITPAFFYGIRAFSRKMNPNQ